MIKDPLTAILMDFNLAFSSEFTAMTEEGFSVGSPRFMAPEVLLGENATEKSDLFSLGLILYDMLTGGLVSTARLSISDLMYTRVPSKPSVSNNNVSSELDKLVMWAVENDPLKRCPSMTVFLKELYKVKKVLVPETVNNFDKPNSQNPDSHCAEHPSEGFSEGPKEPSTEGSSEGAFERSFEDSSCGNYIRSRWPIVSSGRLAGFLIFIILTCSLYIGLSETPERSVLHQFTLPYEEEIPVLDDFDRFTREEARLFAEAGNDEAKIAAHCSLLRGTLYKIKKGTVFSLFLEYRFRTRHDSSYKGASLLRRCNDLYWEQVIAAERVSSGVPGAGNFIFNALWNELSDNPVLSGTLVQDVTNSFYKLHRDVRRSAEGKAFLHTLALCEMYNDPSFLPEDIHVLLLSPPYENNLLKEIRNMVAGKIILRKEITLSSFDLARIDERANLDGGKEFLLKCDELLIQTDKFLETGLKKKEDLRTEAINRNKKQILNLGLSSRNQTKDIKLEFATLIRAFVRYANLARIMIGLSDNEDPWVGYLFETLRHCFDYGSYHYVFLYTLNAEAMSETGPGSSVFAKTYLKYITEAALLRFQSENFKSCDWLIFNFCRMIPDCSRLKENEIDLILTDFVDALAIKAPLTAISVQIFLSGLCKIEAPSYEKVRASFDLLMEREEHLDRSEFRGWSVLTALVAHDLFLEMKEKGLKSERAKLSLLLAQKLARNYDDGGFQAGHRMFHRYSASSILRLTSIIHCCDAFLAIGKDFLKEEPHISEKLEISKALHKLAAQVSRGDGGVEGTVAALKILDGVALAQNDIVMNPLNYW
jgi:hypothetical protein